MRIMCHVILYVYLYKRILYLNMSTRKRESMLKSGRHPVLENNERLFPVSYTHLDVYKRQVYPILTFFPVSACAINKMILSRLVEVNSRRLHSFTSDGLRQPETSVAPAVRVTNYNPCIAYFVFETK